MTMRGAIDLKCHLNVSDVYATGSKILHFCNEKKFHVKALGDFF